jgi:predicted nucleic acid binding AN1-type Zn finger protein
MLGFVFLFCSMSENSVDHYCYYCSYDYSLEEGLPLFGDVQWVSRWRVSNEMKKTIKWHYVASFIY